MKKHSSKMNIDWNGKTTKKAIRWKCNSVWCSCDQQVLKIMRIHFNVREIAKIPMFIYRKIEYYGNITTCWNSIKIEQKMKIAFWFESQYDFSLGSFFQCDFECSVVDSIFETNPLQIGLRRIDATTQNNMPNIIANRLMKRYLKII